jgi:hypothetical protein
LNRTIVIHQPNYLPYLGYFQKASLADVFVFFDTAQFSRGDFSNRNRIRTPKHDGWQWLTLPVGKHRNKRIIDLEITDPDIFEKHAKTIRAVYEKAPFFDETICWLVGHRRIVSSLSYFNSNLITYLFQQLGILDQLEIEYASGLSFECGKKIRLGTDGLIDIIEMAWPEARYISGDGGKGYLEEDKFKETNIELGYLDYETWQYPQIHSGFVPDLSVIDAVFNVGYDAVRKRLTQEKQKWLKKHEGKKEQAVLA